MKFKATKTTISFFIAPTLLVILTRILKDLNMLKIIAKKGSSFLKLRAKKIKAFIAGIFFKLEDGTTMALKVASIYLIDSRRKVEGGFNFCNDRF